MKINIKKLSETAKIPTRGSEYAAGYDLYADNTVTIHPEENQLIHTGIAIEIPEGYFGAIYARSGLATKQGLRPANCVGVIDSDYRGEICVCLYNDSHYTEARIEPNEYGGSSLCFPVINREIKQGDRIAQLVIQKFEPVEFEEVDKLDSTDRGEGGFGSTGTN